MELSNRRTNKSHRHKAAGYCYCYLIIHWLWQLISYNRADGMLQLSQISVSYASCGVAAHKASFLLYMDRVESQQ